MNHEQHHIRKQSGVAEVEQQTENIDRELKALGPAPTPPNRKKRRTHIRELHALGMDPGKDTRLRQALSPTKLTKQGKARLAKRRKKAKAARQARKRK